MTARIRSGWRADGVAELVIDQPERRNALTSAMWRELARRVDEAERDPDVLVLVLRGAGQHFSADAGWAREAGLLTALHPPEELDGAVDALAGTLAARSQVSVRGMKRMVDKIAAGLDEPDEEARWLAADAAAATDFQAGVRAFVQRRPARFGNGRDR